MNYLKKYVLSIMVAVSYTGSAHGQSGGSVAQGQITFSGYIEDLPIAP